MKMIEKMARAIAEDVFSNFTPEQREEGDWEAWVSSAEAALSAVLEPREAIEKMARAICAADGCEATENELARCTDLARAALAALA